MKAHFEFKMNFVFDNTVFVMSLLTKSLDSCEFLYNKNEIIKKIEVKTEYFVHYVTSNSN